MDLKSLIQGKSLVYFEKLSRIRFSCGKTDKTDNESKGQQKSNSKHVARNNTETSNSSPYKLDKNAKSKSDPDGKLKDSAKSKTNRQKDKRSNFYSKSQEIPKQPEVDGANAGTTGNLENLFPSYTVWIVFVFTLVFRLWYVSRRENWWILHPDEVYQTLEVAHSEVYGYGFRTYEYLPEQLPGHHVTASRAKELELGMYSLRSFMLPHLIALFMFIVESLGISASPFLVGKVIHAIISSCLPLTVYSFTMSVYRSRAIASLAAILVATSQALNVFGTHTLVNSFLSPFVFLSLTPLSRLTLQESEELQGQENPEKTCDINQNLSRDLNENLSVFSDRNRNHFKKKLQNGYCDQKHKDEQEIKRRRNVPSTKYINKSFNVQFNIMDYLSGVCLSVCIYTRCDIVFVPLFIAMAGCKFSFPKLVKIALLLYIFITGFVTGVFIGGFYDRLCYGVWFISPMQWVKFNVFHKASHVLFGSESAMFYIEKIFCDDNTGLLLALIVILDWIISRHFPEPRFEEIPKRKGVNFALYVFLLLLLSYTLSNHKELRFFHNGLIFLYIHISFAILRLLKTIVRYANQKQSQYYYSFYLFIGLFTASQTFSFLQIKNEAVSSWTYSRNYQSHNVNMCLDYIRKQDDVTGVFIDQPFHMTGGYTILHKDVQLYALNMFEFYEFNQKHRLNMSNIFNQPLSLSAFGHMSDFISIYNTPYLLKQLIIKQNYNYLVLKTERQFVETGYAEVFRFGSSKVMIRKMANESEAELSKMAATISLGTNATILEYEGYWLVRYGLYKQAEEKLLFSNRLDQSRIGPYQLLIGMFRQFKQTHLVQNVLSACAQAHKTSECLGEYNPVKLHESYFGDM